MISRAIQVATSEPAGPVYMSFPQEIALMPLNGTRYPTVAQLGVARPAAPDPEGIKEIVDHLLKAKNPMVVAIAAGRNDKAVPALTELCELAGIPVVASGHGGYLSISDDPSALSAQRHAAERGGHGHHLRGRGAVAARHERAARQRLHRGDRPRSDPRAHPELRFQRQHPHHGGSAAGHEGAHRRAQEPHDRRGQEERAPTARNAGRSIRKRLGQSSRRTRSRARPRPRSIRFG